MQLSEKVAPCDILASYSLVCRMEPGATVWRWLQSPPSGGLGGDYLPLGIMVRSGMRLE